MITMLIFLVGFALILAYFLPRNTRQVSFTRRWVLWTGWLWLLAGLVMTADRYLLAFMPRSVIFSSDWQPILILALGALILVLYLYQTRLLRWFKAQNWEMH